ncbi:hypothetical protein ACQR3P_28975 [Rhodococcus sp. IEGM1300]
MTTQERLDIVNKLITFISNTGRRLFYSNGTVESSDVDSIAYMTIEDDITYFVDNYTLKKVPVKDSGEDWYGFSHGGTLRALVLDFADFIGGDDASNGRNGYGGIHCDHWGYSPEQREQVIDYAREIGYLKEKAHRPGYPLSTPFDVEALSRLQDRMRYEDEHDYDCQASPRFWMIMDYREVVGNVDYDDGRNVLVHNDGDFTEFNDKDDIREHFNEYLDEDDENVYSELYAILDNENKSYDDAVEYVLENLNKDGHFEELFMRQESFLSYNGFFLTKQEAKEHLKSNSHHYTSNAHTFAMTAWRSPQVTEIYRLLHQADFKKLNQYDPKEDANRIMKICMRHGFFSFINYNYELILDAKHNFYFQLQDVTSWHDIERKLLSGLSRPSIKGVKPKRQERYRKLLNEILGTSFSRSDLELIYTYIGLGANRPLADQFVASRFDLSLLHKEHIMS